MIHNDNLYLIVNEMIHSIINFYHSYQFREIDTFALFDKKINNNIVLI